MFRYEKTPPELASYSREWYVVDHDRGVWLRGLGTSGPSGDRVYVLSVRGRLIPFEVADTDEGALVEQMWTFGASHKASLMYGIEWQTFEDQDERAALEALAAEALLALHAGWRAQRGLAPAQFRLKIAARNTVVYTLADFFGYGAEPLTGFDLTD